MMFKDKDRAPGIPSEERLLKGAVACIECFQQIPCNPCEAACPNLAIHIGDEITHLPVLDEERCNGCGICMTKCPGLAIFMIDKTFSGTKALVSFPYEYYPLPIKGNIVRCTDRNGKYIIDGIVYSVINAKAFDHTAIVTVEIPKEYAMDVRFIDIHSV